MNRVLRLVVIVGVIVVGIVMIGYAATTFVASLGLNPEEAELKEAVIDAARSGLTEMRLVDHINTNREFVCAVNGNHTHDDIQRALGVRYDGQLDHSSDTYQLVLLDRNGQGETMYFAAGGIRPKAGDLLCARMTKAHLRLDARPWDKNSWAIAVMLYEK